MPAWVQPSWPQVQTISILSAIPSQWALQYFSLFIAVQVQAGFAHFLGVVAIRPPDAGSASGVPGFDAGGGRKDAAANIGPSAE
jgi:hypothetical protein